MVGIWLMVAWMVGIYMHGGMVYSDGGYIWWDGGYIMTVGT